MKDTQKNLAELRSVSIVKTKKGSSHRGGATAEVAVVPIQPGQLTFTVTVESAYVIQRDGNVHCPVIRNRLLW